VTSKIATISGFREVAGEEMSKQQLTISSGQSQSDIVLNKNGDMSTISILPEEDSFIKRLRLHQRAVGDFIRTKGEILLLSNMPGNIGDHLIWAGTERLLELEAIPYQRVTVEEVRNSLGKTLESSTLIVPGNAAMTTRWNEWLPGVIQKSSEIFQSVIIFPAEYEPEVESVDSALKCANVFPFAREAESYGQIKHYGKAALSLDPALWAFNFYDETSSDAGDMKLGKVLLALRTDAGSRLSESNLKPTYLNNDISLSTPSLSEFLSLIKTADTIVSDRLHVVVAAVMLGKSVRFIDPYNEKISRYVRYNFEDRFSDRLQQRDEKWLVQIGLAEIIESQS